MYSFIFIEYLMKQFTLSFSLLYGLKQIWIRTKIIWKQFVQSKKIRMYPKPSADFQCMSFYYLFCLLTHVHTSRFGPVKNILDLQEDRVFDKFSLLIFQIPFFSALRLNKFSQVFFPSIFVFFLLLLIISIHFGIGIGSKLRR